MMFRYSFTSFVDVTLQTVFTQSHTGKYQNILNIGEKPKVHCGHIIKTSLLHKLPNQRINTYRTIPPHKQ